MVIQQPCLACEAGCQAYLLEAQELDDAQGDTGVEPEAALVRADGRVELHPVAAVDLHLALVVEPAQVLRVRCMLYLEVALPPATLHMQ